MKKTVAILATLDTKESEVKYVRDRFHLKGLNTLIIDTSILGTPIGISPDVSSDMIARAAGTTIEKLREIYRSPAVMEMNKGIPKIVLDLHEKGKFDGIMTLSGETGGAMAAAATKALPVGVPKLMVCCAFQGTSMFGNFVGTNDVLLMHSVTDILGVNAFTRKIFDTAVAAMAGMVNEGITPEIKGDNLIATTMFGNTTEGVMAVKEIVEKYGYEFVVFHPSGTGGRAMENYIRRGVFKGVLDMTTQDIVDQEYGGFHPGGPTRLEAAGDMGIPQVFVPGCMDFIAVGGADEIPERLRGRKFYPHCPTSTNVRTTKEEMVHLAEIVATKLNKAKGPAAVVIPLKGWSRPNRPGYPLWDQEADGAFIDRLKELLNPDIPVHEVDAHINSRVFAEKAAAVLLGLLERPK